MIARMTASSKSPPLKICRTIPALLESLARRQKNRGDEERQQVVNRAKGDERSENRRSGKERREEKKNDRFEDAQPARHVAGDTGDLREKENRQKFCEGQRKRIGKQDVENAGSAHPVERGNRDLGNEESERGEIEFPLSNAHRLAADGDPEEIGRRGDQQNDSQNANGVEREMNRCRHFRRRGDEQSSA